MATHTFPAVVNKQDSGVPTDLFANQITEAASPSIGDLTCYVAADGGADEGWWVEWTVPDNYVGTPKLVIRGMLDGAPGAAHTLQFGCRPRAVANNESADGTFDAEQTSVVSGRADSIVGSNGAGYADEDEAEFIITLTGTYAPGDKVYAYVFLDASGTDYTGNFLAPTGEHIFFRYNDA